MHAKKKKIVALLGFNRSVIVEIEAGGVCVSMFCHMLTFIVACNLIREKY